jgi:hypothetical protein
MFESVSTPALGVSDTRSIMLADCRRRRGYRPSTPKAHWRREFTYTEGASTFSTELTAENSLTVADGRVLTCTEGDVECSLIPRVTPSAHLYRGRNDAAAEYSLAAAGWRVTDA